MSRCERHKGEAGGAVRRRTGAAAAVARLHAAAQGIRAANLEGEAFLFERSIDIETYDRHAERLREELTLARIAKHSTELDELDVEGILSLAERVLPRGSELWVQSSLDQRQRFQQLSFPDGIAFDGSTFVGTAATARAFGYLPGLGTGDKGWWTRTAPVGTSSTGSYGSLTA